MLSLEFNNHLYPFDFKDVHMKYLIGTLLGVYFEDLDIVITTIIVFIKNQQACLATSSPLEAHR